MPRGLPPQLDFEVVEAVASRFRPNSEGARLAGQVGTTVAVSHILSISWRWRG